MITMGCGASNSPTTMLQPVASVPVQSEQRQAVFSDEPRPVDPKDKKNSFYKRTASTYLLYGEAKACAKAYAEIEQEMSNSKPRESERPAWLLACSFSDSSCTTSGSYFPALRFIKPSVPPSLIGQREAFAIDLGHRITSTFLPNYFDDENWLEFGQDKIRLQGKDHEQKYGHLFKQKLSPQNGMHYFCPLVLPHTRVAEATPRAAVLGGMGPIACATAFHSLVETIDKDETPDDLKRDLVLHLWSDPGELRPEFTQICIGGAVAPACGADRLLWQICRWQQTGSKCQTSFQKQF